MDTAEGISSAAASMHTASSASRPSSSSSAPPTEPASRLPAGAPTSPLFEIRHTPTAGRAVFASQDIPEDTLVFRCSDLSLCVLLREYQREVCGQCFGYDYGRDLGIRDKIVGFAFCSQACQNKWREENGEVGKEAWAAVENFVKGRGKEDNDMVDADLPRPKVKDIKKAWDSVAAQAALIRVAREGETGHSGEEGAVQITKQHRKALSKARQATISPDIMSFCLSGVLWHHMRPLEWEKFLALAEDRTPYQSIDDLYAYTKTYLALLAVLPVPLLPLVTAEMLYLISSRDSHNSFGIRSLEDDGSEFFGFGCWPAASYFNHSCNPNLEKKRVGRTWEFRASTDIAKGDQMCITYLSGEERKLSRGKRMITLRKNWGFECACERCETVLGLSV
jgi:hypothetical protein